MVRFWLSIFWRAAWGKKNRRVCPQNALSDSAFAARACVHTQLFADSAEVAPIIGVSPDRARSNR